MAVWPVTRQWTDYFVGHYRHRAKAVAQRYLDDGRRFTCEDLALHAILSFAKYYELPVIVKNGIKPNGYDPRASHESFFDFQNTILRTTGATDLIEFENTVDVRGNQGSSENLWQAQPGDIIFMQYSDHGHIQLVTEVSQEKITIVQGNYDNWARSSADPSDRYYLGAVVRECYYDRNGNYFKDGAQQQERPFHAHSGRVRRWNFFGGTLRCRRRSRPRGWAPGLRDSRPSRGLLVLLEALLHAHPGIARDQIVGHSDVGTRKGVLGRKGGDPGLMFDWHRLEAQDMSLGVNSMAGPQPITIYGGFFAQVSGGTLRENDNDAHQRFGGRHRPTVTGTPNWC